MTNAALIGYWKITKMEVWDAAYVDLVVPGFIEFEMEDDHLMGQFQFGTVSGWLDCRVRDVSGESYVEWSWEGRSDSDPGCGRGWAHVEDGKLVGRLFIHCGDDQPSKPRDRGVLEIATRGGGPPGASPFGRKRFREKPRCARVRAELSPDLSTESTDSFCVQHETSVPNGSPNTPASSNPAWQSDGGEGRVRPAGA